MTKNSTKVAQQIIGDIYEYLDSSGDAPSGRDEYDSNSRSRGMGGDSYRDESLSPELFLTKLLEATSFNEKNAWFVAIELLTIANDYCWERPQKLPGNAAAYKPGSKNDKWSKDVLSGIVDIIGSGYDNFKKENNKMTSKNTNETEPKKPTGFKTRAINATKKAAKKAVIRKVSRRLAKNVRETAIKQLESNPQFAALVASPVGQLAVPALLAVGLEMLPLPEAVRYQLAPFKDQLVEELTVQAIDDGTAPLEEMVAFLLPALKDVLPMLASANTAVAQIASEASAEVISAKVKS